MSKPQALSFERWRATARERRRYGGKTVTKFYVWTDSYDTLEVVGYGPTPAARKAYATKAAKKIWEKQTNGS